MISHIFFAVLIFVVLYCAWRISVADFRHRIIPDIYLFPILLAGLITVTFYPWVCTPGDAAVAATFGYIMAWGLGILFGKLRKTDTPIGMGDVKLIATGGIWLGTTGLALSLVISCILGMIWGAYRRQRYIPFGPFFIAGGILALIALTFLI